MAPSCLPTLEPRVFVSNLRDNNSWVSVELDPGRLDRIPPAVKIPMELFYETESLQTFGHLTLRKGSASVKCTYLDVDEFPDLMIDGLDRGCPDQAHFNE
jgi:hypothetical protein